jgi:hypothetical protein
LNTLYTNKHNEKNHHHLKVIDSKTPASPVIAQTDAIDLNSRRDDDDDLDTNVSSLGSPKDVRDCDAQRDPTLAENVWCFNSASTFLNSKLLHSARTFIIERQHFKTSFLRFRALFPL